MGLRGSTAASLGQLKAWLPRAARPSRVSVVDGLYSLILGGAGPRSGVKTFHILYRNATRLARSFELGEIRRAFERDLSMLIGENAMDRVFVHAGVVGIGDGAILVPGKSFSGKTTLIHALVEQGGVYYSDEFAVLDSRGNVFPWAEPLSIRRHGPRKAGEPRSAESLGMAIGRRSLPVRMVVLTCYEAGRRFRPKAVGPGQGVLGLLENTMSAQRNPRAALRALTSVVSGASVVSGPRGEATSTARIIRRMIEATLPA